MAYNLIDRTELEVASLQERLDRGLTVRADLAVREPVFPHSAGVYVVTHDVVTLQRQSQSHWHSEFAQPHKPNPPGIGVGDLGGGARVQSRLSGTSISGAVCPKRYLRGILQLMIQIVVHRGILHTSRCERRDRDVPRDWKTVLACLLPKPTISKA